MRTGSDGKALMAGIWLLGSLPRLVVLALVAATPAQASVLENWTEKLHARCPNAHADWIADSARPGLIAAFGQSLTANENARIDQIANPALRCRSETLGFACEMSAYLEAYEKTGLLDRFVTFDCRTVKCEDLALCSRTPPGS